MLSRNPRSLPEQEKVASVAAKELLEEAHAAEEEEPQEGGAEQEEAAAAEAVAFQGEEAEEGLVEVEDVVRRLCLSNLSSFGVLGKWVLFEGIIFPDLSFCVRSKICCLYYSGTCRIQTTRPIESVAAVPRSLCM